MTRASKSPLNSSVAIARLLDSEGFSDHVGAMVERYWKRNIMQARKAARIERAERAFSEQIISKLTDADRIVLGKWVGLQKKMSFDAGLRIGLATLFQYMPVEDDVQAYVQDHS
jgi:hypothetical protein